jgi:hypothetical protein
MECQNNLLAPKAHAKNGLIAPKNISPGGVQLRLILYQNRNNCEEKYMDVA